jgi:hypothetical protein
MRCSEETARISGRMDPALGKGTSDTGMPNTRRSGPNPPCYPTWRPKSVSCFTSVEGIMRIGIVIAVVLTLSLIACTPSTFMRNALDRVAPDDDESFAKDYIGFLRARDLESCVRLLDQRFVKPGIESELSRVAELLEGPEEPLSAELVGCYVSYTDGKRRSQLTYQYQFQSRESRLDHRPVLLPHLKCPASRKRVCEARSIRALDSDHFLSSWGNHLLGKEKETWTGAQPSRSDVR